MEKYNLNELVSVKVTKEERSFYYTFKSEKKFLGIVLRKAGVYGYVDNYFWRELPASIFVKDGKVYNKPTVILYYSNGRPQFLYFNTYEDAVNYSEGITSAGNWILK